MKYIRGIMLTMFFVSIFSFAFAQHVVQFDDGAGHYGVLSATGLTAPVTSFTFPPTGGMIGVVPPPGTPAVMWLTDPIGNTLTGTLPASPTERFGSGNNADVVMMANGSEKMRLVSGGGVKVGMASGSSSTDLVVSNSGVLETRTVGSLPLASSSEPFLTIGNTAGLTAERAIAVNSTLSGSDGGPNTSYTLGINLANPNIWTGTQTYGAQTFTPNTVAALAAGNTNDWATPGTANSYFRISASGAATLTGITGGAAGRVIILSNVGANPITLRHQTGSAAVNQFDLPGASDIILATRGAVTLVYDGTTSRWSLVSTN